MMGKKFVAGLLTAVAACCLAFSVACSPQEQESGTKFTVVSGSAEQSGNTVTATGNDTLAIYSSDSLLDGEITATITVGSRQGSGIVFRVDDAGNTSYFEEDGVSYYMVLIDATGNVILAKVQDGGWDTLDTSLALVGGFDPAAQYTLTVSVDGSDIAVYHDDEQSPLLDYTDYFPLAGTGFGVRLGGSGAKAESFSYKKDNVSFVNGLMMWEPYEGAQGYAIYLDGTQYGEALGADVHQADIRDLAPGEYEVSLRAVTANGEETIYTEEWVKTGTPEDMTTYYGNFVQIGSDTFESIGGRSILLYDDVTFESGILTGSVTPGSANDCGILFAVSHGNADSFWEQSGVSYYMALLNSQGLLIFGEYNNGWTSHTGESEALSATYNPAKTYNFTISRSASGITISCSDGAITTSVELPSDQTPLSGIEIGFRAGAGGVRFSGLTVSRFDLESISMHEQPVRTIRQGEAIPLDGLTIEAAYADGPSEIIAVTQDMISGYDANATGEQTVTVTYTEGDITKTTTFTVNVIQDQPFTIAVTTPIANDKPYQRDELDLTGMMITVTWQDGTKEEIAVTQSMLSGYDPDTEGEQTVTVTYDWFGTKATTAFTVNVQHLAPVSVGIPYDDGEYFLTVVAGGDDIYMDVAVEYNSGDKVIVPVTSDMIKGYNADKLGEQTITVSFTDNGTTVSTQVTIEVVRGTEFWEEDFDDAADGSMPDDLNVESQGNVWDYSVQDGALYIEGTGNTQKLTMNFNEMVPYEDFILEADVTVDSYANGARWIGLMVENADGTNWYAGVVKFEGFVQFLEWVPSTPHGGNRVSGAWGENMNYGSDEGYQYVVDFLWAEFLKGIGTGVSYHFALMVKDGTMVFAINNVIMATRELPEGWQAGYVGLAMSGVIASFDNFRVTGIQSESDLYGVWEARGNDSVRFEFAGDNQVTAMLGEESLAGTYSYMADGSITATIGENTYTGSYDAETDTITLIMTGIGDMTFIRSTFVISMGDQPISIIKQGENIPFDEYEFTIKVEYTDGTSASVSVTQDMISGYHANTTGEQTVTVTYTEGEITKTTTFTVTVIAAQDFSIAIKTPITASTLYAGQALDLTGMTITATWGDAAAEEISVTQDMISGYDPNKVGPQTVTITYSWFGTDATTTFEVTVKEVVPVSVALPDEHYLAIALQGEIPSMQVMVTYSDGSVKYVDVTSEMISGYDPETLGKQTITVTYTEDKTSVTVQIAVEVVMGEEAPFWEEDFEDITGMALPSDIKVESQGSTWNYYVQDGKLYIEGTGTTQKLTMNFSQQVPYDEFILEADVAIDSYVNSGRWIGLMIESKDGTNWYAGTVKFDGYMQFLEWKPTTPLGGNRVSGAWGTNTNYGSNEGYQYAVDFLWKTLFPAVGTGTSFHFTLMVKEGTMVFAINHLIVATRELPEGWQAGYVGLAMSGVTASFDNFRITGIGTPRAPEPDSGVEDVTFASDLLTMNLGDALDPGKMTLTVHYYGDKPDAEITVTSDMVTGFVQNKAGRFDLTVTYVDEEGKTWQFETYVIVLDYDAEDALLYEGFDGDALSDSFATYYGSGVSSSMGGGTYNFTSTSSTPVGLLQYEGDLSATETTVNGVTYNNYRIDVDITVESVVGDNRQIGIFVRHQEKDGMGLWTNRIHENGRISQCLWKHGNAAAPASGSWGTAYKQDNFFAFEYGRTYHLTVIVVGMEMYMYLDYGFVQSHTLDAGYETGTFGLITVGMNASFDNLLVTPVGSDGITVSAQGLENLTVAVDGTLDLSGAVLTLDLGNGLVQEIPASSAQLSLDTSEAGEKTATLMVQVGTIAVEYSFTVTVTA